VEPIRRHRGEASPPLTGRGRAVSPDGPASVYPPREDSLLLAKFAAVPAARARVLEIGAGTGLSSLTAARVGAAVVATDLNPFALRLLGRRAREEGLEIALVRTDLAAGLGRFDRILANPPYLPTRPEERDPDPWHNLALDGGPDGCRVLERLVEQLDEHLTPTGEAFVVVSSLQDEARRAEIRDGWRRRGGTVEVVDARSFEGERLEVWRFRGSAR
jgi:release factor glutamine methyltransferase